MPVAMATSCTSLYVRRHDDARRHDDVRRHGDVRRYSFTLAPAPNSL